MKSFAEQFSTLHRPRILIQAAEYYQKNIGNTGMRRKRLSGIKTAMQLLRLIDDEQHQEEFRRTRGAEYCVKTHIELLAELILAAKSLRKQCLMPV